MPDRTPFSVAEWGAIVVIVLVWGINNAAAEVATAVLPPLLVGGLRFAIGAALLGAFLRPPFGDLRQLLVLCLFLGPVHYALIYWGFSLTEDLSPFAVSLQLWIPLVAVFSWIILGERLSGAAAVGLCVAFAGVVWMTLDVRVIRDADALAIGVAASAAIAFGTVMARRYRKLPPLKLQAAVSLFAAVTLLGGAAAFEPGSAQAIAEATPLAWAAVAWAGIASTVVATGLFLWLVQRRETARFTPYFLTTPLVSCAIGVAFLDDVLNARIIVGGLATLAGVGLVALGERRLPPPVTEPA